MAPKRYPHQNQSGCMWHQHSWHRKFPAKTSLPSSGSQKQHGSTQGVPEQFVWVCNLCQQVFRYANKRTLMDARNRHIHKEHRAQRAKVATCFNRHQKHLVAEASDQIPTEQRAWSCPKCGKGLAYMGQCALKKSRDAEEITLQKPNLEKPPCTTGQRQCCWGNAFHWSGLGDLQLWDKVHGISHPVGVSNEYVAYKVQLWDLYCPFSLLGGAEQVYSRISAKEVGKKLWQARPENALGSAVENTRILAHSSSTSKTGASRNQSLTFWTSAFVVIRMFVRCRSVSGFAISVRTGTSSPTPAHRIVTPTMTILLLEGTWPMWPDPQMPGLSHDGSLQKSRQLRPFKNIVCCQTNAQIWPSSCCRKGIRAGLLPLRRPQMC